MRKMWMSFRYRYAMVQAYLMQEYAPLACAQWLTEADHWEMELWRMEKGLVK